MTASGEVRLVPMSEARRDWLERIALHAEKGDLDMRAEEVETINALVTAWDAAVPGVVDASWAEVRDLVNDAALDWKSALSPAARGKLGRAFEIARAAAGGEAAATGERITHGRHCTCSACAREDWTSPDLAPCGMHGSACLREYQPWGPAGSYHEPAGGAQIAAIARFFPSGLDEDSERLRATIQRLARGDEASG